VSAAASWLSLLVPDPRGQRAVEETLADWREEVGRAQTVGERVQAHAHGLRSFAYLASGLLWDQSISADLWRTFVRTLAITVGLACVLGVVMVWMVGGDGAFGPFTASAYVLAMMSGFVPGIFGLVGSMGAGSSDARPGPVAAVAGLFFVWSAVMTSWILPAMAAPFLHEAAGAYPTIAVPRYVAPLIVHVASLTFASTYYLLGATIRRRFATRGWRTRQTWALMGALAIVALGIGARLALASAGISGPDRMAWLDRIMWLQLTVAWAMIVWFARPKAEPIPAPLET